MKPSIIKKAKKIISKVIIRRNESSEKFDRTQKHIEAVRVEMMLKHPEVFIHRGAL